MLTGVDVHGSKGAIDWPGVAGQGYDFAIVKAAEGNTFTDARVGTNRRQARAAGLMVGTYHFARPSSGGYSLADAEDEARHYLGIIGPGLTDEEVVVLDLEDDRVSPGRPLQSWALRWLEVVEAATGRVPILYSYAPYLREHIGNDGRFRRYPLWLADYTPPAAVVAPWGGHTIWQHTSSGTVHGIPGRADLNRFDGDAAAFRRLAVPPTTPQEALAMGYIDACLIPGQTAPWPGGRWTFYAVTPEGQVDVLNDVSQLGGKPSAHHFGDLRGRKLAGPVVELVPTLSGRGYWLVAADGGVFTFGDAPFHGSHGPERENGPVVSLVPLYGEYSEVATGYVLLAADGGTFNYGTGTPAR